MTCFVLYLLLVGPALVGCALANSIDPAVFPAGALPLDPARGGGCHGLVIVAPFNIEVLVGDVTAVERVYGDLTGSETSVISRRETIVVSR